MFKSVRIQNFRQFKDLKLDGLAQINLITGKNNTGKTSLLEALLLHVSPTTPEIVLTVARTRGMETVNADGPNAWGWIFRDGAESDVITIESQDSMDNRVTQRITTSQGLQFPQSSFPVSNGPSGTFEPVITTSGRPLHSLVFEYEDLQGLRGLSRIRLDGGDTTVEHNGGEFRFKNFYLATGTESSSFAAQVFSRVVLSNREDEILDAVRVVDPRLKRVRVLDTGTGPSVHVDLGDGRFRPANVAGRGFSRILTLASVIVDTAGGLLLVDEIEDGLHYSVLPDVWKAIIAAARRHSVQIFVTTHSYECLEAAVQGSRGHEGKLAMFRLERDAERVIAVDVDDEGLRDAISLGFEMR